MLQKKPAVVEAPDAQPFVFKRGQIELRDVSFGHKRMKSNSGDENENITNGDTEEVIEDEEAEVKYLFKNLNLTIEAGSTNAIVGSSGFGKTSMLHLMFRIYDPINGQVLIDGQDLKGLTFESFRKHIVVVPQNGILFNDTIEANLRYGYPEATQDDLERVAR